VQQETGITASSAGVVLTLKVLLAKLSVEKIVIRLGTAYGDKDNQESNQLVFHLDEQKLSFANVLLRLPSQGELVPQPTADMMCTVRE